MTPQKLKQAILSMLADRWDELGPYDGLDAKDIAQKLNSDLEKTRNAVHTLLTLEVVDMNMGFQNVHLTPAGYSQARPNDPTIPRAGGTNVSFGNVSQSAVAFQNSSATMTVNVSNFLQTLAAEIEKSSEIPQEEKTGMLQGIQDLIQHPVVSGIISTLVAGSIQAVC